MKKIFFYLFLAIGVELMLQAQENSVTITGTVVNQNNIPLSKVVVAVKGTDTKTSTDFNGKYTLKCAKNNVISYSLSNYESKKVTVNGEPVINLTLIEIQDEESTFYIGMNTGIDYNVNAYKLDANKFGNTFYGENNKKLYNLGIDFGMMVTNRFRPRIEIKYVKMAYGVYWKENTLFNKNGSEIVETKVGIFNGNLNLHLDYMAINTNKFQAFISPGLKYEFLADKEMENIFKDGTKSFNEHNEVYDQYPKKVAGGSMTMILKYNITKNIGLTLTPEYTLFFREYLEDNDKLYQRFSCFIGLEYKLSPFW
jgi:hypothetical protein